MHHDEPYCSRATVIDREPTVDKKNHAASAPYDGWRPTTVDVPVASGDGSTPQPVPTPFTMGAVLVQALVLLKDVSDRSERARPRMDYAVP